ncbi:MAG: HAD-IIIA family hydrolase [archaeon]
MHELISRLYLNPAFVFELFFAKKYSTPHLSLKDITEIDMDYLKEQGIDTLLFDADNTLYKHHEYKISDPRIDEAFQILARNFNIAIVSNNNSPDGRKKLNDYFSKYAEENGLAIYVVQTTIKKPSDAPFDEAMEHYGTIAERTGMVGDNTLTDIVGANHRGLKLSIKVEPLSLGKENWYFKPARYLEDRIRKKKK